MMKRRLKHHFPQPGRHARHDPIAAPLFPEIGPSVTAADIALWIESYAPRISAPRRARYALDYDIAGKVARAKLAGHWPP